MSFVSVQQYLPFPKPFLGNMSFAPRKTDFVEVLF